MLGLIPAKGGSTRLARKNVALLDGRPLIGWAAEAARESGVIDRLVLSTEDSGVAETARGLGIETPFRRPAELARDPAGVVEVALHALEQIDAGGNDFDTLVILLPTCPFRTATDIREAMATYRSRGATSLMSVAPYDHTPFAALGVAEDGFLEPYFPERFERRSQEQPDAFRPNGAIHILDVGRFRETRSYTAPPVMAYVMPRERSVDIDTKDDLVTARAMIEMRRQNQAQA